MSKAKTGKLLHGHNTTVKQEIFCQELVKTQDLKAAAQKAYPNQAYPLQQGYDNIEKPNVIARINELRHEAINLLKTNPTTTLANLVKITADHSTATKKHVYNAQGEYIIVEDRETQAKGVDRALRLYGLMERHSIDQPSVHITFQADVDKLAKAQAELAQLNASLGFKTIDI